jgi:hypothetical protein
MFQSNQQGRSVKKCLIHHAIVDLRSDICSVARLFDVPRQGQQAMFGLGKIR